jgi:hypothetical protein
VSCASPGNCSAGGTYTDASGHGQAFVVAQVNGRWGTAEEVPGTGALNRGWYATGWSVSCAAAGDCSGGGYYTARSGAIRAFIAVQANGRWDAAKEVPGIAALNQGGYARIASVSCATAARCSAGGVYTDSSHHQQAFVVSET